MLEGNWITAFPTWMNRSAMPSPECRPAEVAASASKAAASNARRRLFVPFFIKPPRTKGLKAGINAMLGVGRDENVPADVYAGAGAFLERDHRQPIEKMVQHLLALPCGLLRDAVTNLS